MLKTLRHVVVDPGENVVVRRHGALLPVLTPGRHPRRFRASYVPVDVRIQDLQIPTQEVPTSEGALVKVTPVLTWRVADPVAFLDVARDPLGRVYLAAQVALREVFAELDVETATRQGRRDPVLVAAVRQGAELAGAEVGIEVLRVQLKDVIAPVELRYAALALVTARQRGLAKLEEARAETAALRSLANAAALLDAHPALARIRMIEAAPPGAVIRIGTADTAEG